MLGEADQIPCGRALGPPFGKVFVQLLRPSPSGGEVMHFVGSIRSKLGNFLLHGTAFPFDRSNAVPFLGELLKFPRGYHSYLVILFTSSEFLE